MINKLILTFFCFFIVTATITDVASLCYSSCDTCFSSSREINGCATCSSAFLVYQPLNDPGPCIPNPSTTAQQNVQLFSSIDKNTLNANRYFRSYTTDDTKNTTTSTLGTLGVFNTSNIASLNGLVTPKIIFSLTSLGLNHYGIYFRLYAYQSCTGSQSFYFKIDGIEYPSISMVSGEYKIIEPATMIRHTSYDLDLSFGFSATATCTERSISDVSVYIMKCQKGCAACKDNSVTCLTCEPSYLFNNETKKCIPTNYCHSSCDTCSEDGLPTKCTACSTNISALSYENPPSAENPGACSMTATNNAQVFMVVDKNTVLGVSLLKSLGYNGIINTTSGLVIGHQMDYIDLKIFASNTIIFGFDTSATHQKFHVRARVFTECSTENKTVKMTLSGTPPEITTASLTSMTSTIIEGSVDHTGTTFNLTFEFGTQGELCSKIIKDITIYFQKCPKYCGSNDCPDAAPYYKHRTLAKCVNDCNPEFAYAPENKCLADCPDGWTKSGYNCVKKDYSNQTQNSVTQCSQSLSKCTTNHSLYFVIVLDFVYEEFSSSIYDSFLDQILVLVAFPAEWSRQLKLKYLKIHNLIKGSVYINGTFYYLNESGLITAKTRFKALSQNALSLGGFRVQSMGFLQKSPATNEVFFGNNTLIVPEPINAQNCNDSENPSSCTEQSSSSSMIIIIAAGVGGGVLIVVVGVVIYCCWKRKKTLKETNEKEDDESKSDSTQQIDNKDGLKSAQNLRSNREQKVQNVGKQLRFD